MICLDLCQAARVATLVFDDGIPEFGCSGSRLNRMLRSSVQARQGRQCI